ncbi:MAG: BrnT family toxin [Treponema sp.]|nr:BrnT family toxin [Treponema sp.]
MCMTFEWDENKNSENIAKHKVSFEKAQDAFFDEKRIILEDIKHSVSEKRYFCIGKTAEGVLTVRFTMRNQNIRIIGAGYWRQGKKRYEEHLQ